MKKLNIINIQLNPDNLNLQGKSKKVQVTGSRDVSNREKEEKYCLRT